MYILNNEISFNNLLGDFNNRKDKIQAEVPSDNGLMVNESPQKLHLVEDQKNEMDEEAQAVPNSLKIPASQNGPKSKEGSA